MSFLSRWYKFVIFSALADISARVVFEAALEYHVLAKNESDGLALGVKRLPRDDRCLNILHGDCAS